MSSSQYTIGYSPNDFFYVNAQNNNMMPTEDQCNSLQINDPTWTTKCNGDNFMDNSLNCVNQALCQNKANAVNLQSVRNKNDGADSKFLDSTSVFNKTILNTINLSIGILLVGYLIYKNRVLVT
jgi:hypothetical protein|uniref:Uncharacterized protein n=1 Tax=viral metagenome TaxID=1070528 RepID=A0A6C0ARZ2_9ZZZZ